MQVNYTNAINSPICNATLNNKYGYEHATISYGHAIHLQQPINRKQFIYYPSHTGNSNYSHEYESAVLIVTLTAHTSTVPGNTMHSTITVSHGAQWNDNTCRSKVQAKYNEP